MSMIEKQEQSQMASTPASKSPPASTATPSHKERSPNYPAMPFMDALERIRKVYALEKKHPVRTEIAAKHMGWSLNGRTRMYIAAMKQYGLLLTVGVADVRVSDQAAEILVYPESEPRRAALIRQLALQPKPFQQVIAKYGTSLPSDDSLRAYLHLELGFTEEACPVFIKVLKHAIAITGIDAAPIVEETGNQDAPPEATMMPQTVADAGSTASQNLPKETPTSGREQHKWKLADGVWAEITITGKLGAKSFERLKKYVDLIDISEHATEDEE